MISPPFLCSSARYCLILSPVLSERFHRIFMKFKPSSSAVLVLEDGTIFHGLAAGKIGTTTGEIAFNTGMTGYQEIFTDPSYYGQILIMTTPHIGNYGVDEDEFESGSVNISGLVSNKFSEIFSRAKANQSIDEYFKERDVVGITEVDTRALVRHIREKGAMNAIISSEIDDISELKSRLGKVPSMEGLELASKVSTKEPFTYGDAESHEFKVAVLDLGVKQNILRCLAERGCYMKVFPHNTPFQEMETWNPDGYMLSNGPGDPSAMPEPTRTVTNILEHNRPTFGICLGHQVMAQASGLQTEKMHHGHRGINHPILNLHTGKGEITSQNHGFMVNRTSAENTENIQITHIHLNDKSVAGIKRKDKPAFSVQYHPEASAGPHDSRYLFDDFIALMKKEKYGVNS
jgi:carbamoyl-phosphate synthase small subunit